MDLGQAEKCLSAHREIRFAVPVHLFGHALDLDRLADLRDRFELRVVEDAAQAVGAEFGERNVGSVGQATAVSFYPTKNLGALGDGVKAPRPSEMKNRDVVRKILVALTPIRAGERFTEENLGAKRPGAGVSPMEYWEWLGRRADRDTPAGAPVRR